MSNATPVRMRAVRTTIVTDDQRLGTTMTNIVPFAGYKSRNVSAVWHLSPLPLYRDVFCISLSSFGESLFQPLVTDHAVLTFYPTQQTRRTHYGLTKQSTIPDAQLKSILETAVKHTPSAFNSQSARVVMLLGKESDKLWDIVKTAYVPTLGGDGQCDRSTLLCTIFSPSALRCREYHPALQQQICRVCGWLWNHSVL